MVTEILILLAGAQSALHKALEWYFSQSAWKHKI